MRSYWQNTFYAAAGVYAVATLLYILLGSGEEQEWAKRKKEDTPEDSSVENADYINGPWAGLPASNRQFADNPTIDVF